NLGVNRSTLVTIQDNDAGFGFPAGSINVMEGAPQVDVTVLRQDDLGAAASVDYATADGTAKAGNDYQAVSGTLTFAAGQTGQTVSIALLNDSLKETTENFRVLLSSPSAGTSLGAQSALTVYIEDNETGVEFTQPDFGIAKNEDSAVLEVRRGGAGGQDVGEG